MIKIRITVNAGNAVKVKVLAGFFYTLNKNPKKMSENANKKIPPEIMPRCEKSNTNPYHHPNRRFCLHFEALFH